MKTATNKRNIHILITFVIIIAGMLNCHTSSFAKDDFEDVVYLKNGSIVRGMIMEQIPNESVKIETYDGSIFVYKMDEIEKITKEPIKKDKKGRITRVVPKEPEKYPLGDFTLLFNPGGFLTQGPQLMLDIRLSRYFSFGFTSRYPIAGLLGKDVEDRDYEHRRIENTEYLAGGISFKLLPVVENKNRFYIGLIGEVGYYSHYKLDSANSSGFWSRETKSEKTVNSAVLSPMLNIGYRFRFQPFSLNVGAFGGFRWFLHDGEVKPKPLYMLDISLGYEF